MLLGGLNVPDIRRTHSYTIFTRKASGLIQPRADFPGDHSCPFHTHPEFIHPSSPFTPAILLNPSPEDTIPSHLTSPHLAWNFLNTGPGVSHIPDSLIPRPELLRTLQKRFATQVAAKQEPGRSPKARRRPAGRAGLGELTQGGGRSSGPPIPLPVP